MDDVEDATLEGNLTITPNIDLGIPEAGITWLHNNNVLSPDTDSRVEISEGGVLTVRDVQASDRGTYTVRASNGIGTDAEASVDVTIECEFNCMNCSHSFCLIVVLYIVLELDDPTFVLTMGGGLNVTCIATGYPAPEVMINSSSSQSDTEMTVTVSTFEETLSVRYTYDTCDPQQVYECAASAGSLNRTSEGLASCCKYSRGCLVLLVLCLFFI